MEKHYGNNGMENSAIFSLLPIRKLTLPSNNRTSPEIPMLSGDVTEIYRQYGKTITTKKLEKEEFQQKEY